MGSFTRIFWGITLCFFLVGCGHQAYRLPPNTDPVGEAAAEPPVVKVGQVAKVVTTDGSKVEGEVMAVSESEIVIGRTGNYGFEKIVIPADEIAEIKVEKVSKVVTGVTLGLVIILSLGVLALSQVEWGSS